jgi:hypothetical protein
LQQSSDFLQIWHAGCFYGEKSPIKFLAQNIQICPFYEGPKFAHFIKSDITKKLPGSTKLGIFSKTKHILNTYNLAHRALITPSLKVKGQGHIFLVKNLILNFKIQ